MNINKTQKSTSSSNNLRNAKCRKECADDFCLSIYSLSGVVESERWLNTLYLSHAFFWWLDPNFGILLKEMTCGRWRCVHGWSYWDVWVHRYGDWCHIVISLQKYSLLMQLSTTPILTIYWTISICTKLYTVLVHVVWVNAKHNNKWRLSFYKGLNVNPSEN